MTLFMKILDRMNQLTIQSDPDQLIGVRRNAAGGIVCYYCGKLPDFRGFNYEHLAPTSLGGEDENWNIVLACFNCNQRKKAKTPPRWFMEESLTFSRLPNEIAIDLLARLLLNLHMFMLGKDVSRIMVSLGISEVGYVPRFEGDHQMTATVGIASKAIHPDFECSSCHEPCVVECSAGMYILKTHCASCGQFNVYQGFPFISKGRKIL